jgi:hypothetical protein
VHHVPDLEQQLCLGHPVAMMNSLGFRDLSLALCSALLRFDHDQDLSHEQ